MGTAAFPHSSSLCARHSSLPTVSAAPRQSIPCVRGVLGGAGVGSPCPKSRCAGSLVWICSGLRGWSVPRHSRRFPCRSSASSLGCVGVCAVTPCPPPSAGDPCPWRMAEGQCAEAQGVAPASAGWAPTPAQAVSFLVSKVSGAPLFSFHCFTAVLGFGSADCCALHLCPAAPPPGLLRGRTAGLAPLGHRHPSLRAARLTLVFSVAHLSQVPRPLLPLAESPLDVSLPRPAAPLAPSLRR